MTTDIPAVVLARRDRSWLRLAGWSALIGGAAVVIDSLAVDAWGVESLAPNLLGVLAPVFGIVGVSGLRSRLAAQRPGRWLDLAWASNVAGLALVVAIDFARELVLRPLPDQVAEDLLVDGPTRPALFAAALVYIAGTIAFGACLLRRRYQPVAAWVYVLSAVPSGLVVLLPPIPGAIAQALAGAAVLAFGAALLRDAD